MHRTLTRRTVVLGLASTLGLVACSPLAPAASPATSAPATSAPPASSPPPAAGTPATSDSTQIKRGGTMTVGLNFDVVHFDPLGIGTTQFPIFLQIFSTLTRLDHQLKPQPELAESWNVAPDFSGMQLTLRQGATFHNGKEVTTDDVIATINRYKDPKNGANIQSQVAKFTSVTATDKYNLQIGFDSPLANIFDALDLLFILDKDNDDVKSNPNGSGPFKLAAWTPGDSIHMARNPNYYKPGLPYLDEILLKVYPDVQALIVALQTSAVDLTSRLQVRDKQPLDSSPGITVQAGTPGSIIFCIAVNTTRAPFTDKRVRQAISWAFDRQRFTSTFLVGSTDPWCLPWPPYSPAYDATLNKAYIPNDPAKAKQLLADAGYPNGFEMTILANKTRGGLAEMAQLLQNDLQQVGITAKIDVEEEAAWLPLYSGVNYDIATASTGRTSKHPGSLFNLNVNFRGENNYEGFGPPEYKRLTGLTLTTFDPTQSKAVYDQLNQMIIDESFDPVVAPQTNYWGLRNYVTGRQSSLDDWDIFETTWLNK